MKPVQYTKVIRPSHDLDDAVRFYMLFRSELSDSSPSIVFPLPPSPSHFLCFYGFHPASLSFNQSNHFSVQSSTVIVGPNDQTIFVQLPKSCFLVRVVLHVGALFRLTGLPITELVDVPGFDSDLLLPDMKIVNQKMAVSKSDLEAIEHIEKYLRQKLAKSPPALPIDFALEKLIKSGGNMSIDELAATGYLSIRQAERQCLRRTGYSPKYLARLSRFTKAWAMKEQNPKLDWNSIALQNSYYDLQHLKKDFAQFTLTTPLVASQQIKDIPIDLLNNLLFK
jgi:hypothetical protein